LALAIQRLLPQSPAVAHAPRHAEDAAAGGPPLIYVVDDDDSIRGAIRAVLEDDGRAVEDFDTCEAFLAAFHPGRAACLVIDAYLPGMNGLILLRRLREAGHALPAIMITGNSDVAIAVEAMKAGATDFIEKPISRVELLASVDHALERSRDSGKLSARRNDAASHVARPTPRPRHIMDMVLAGHPSKNIAADLGISQRTVENHRASIMAKTDTKSLPALARMALAAVDADADGIRR
jgi:two-component system CheB/CheR fusion protein